MKFRIKRLKGLVSAYCLMPLFASAAIPEPAAILYGTVPASAGSAPTVRWTLTGNSEALIIPAA